jgi:isopenicillin N synthase-like dioxygenase
MNIINPETAEVWDAAKYRKTIPVIDFAKTQDTASLADEIGNACKEWGFFQIVNHGISTETMGTLWDCTHNFFSLPKIQKTLLKPHERKPLGIFRSRID